MPFAYVDNQFSRTGKKNVPLLPLAEKIGAPFYFYDLDEVLARANWFRRYSKARVHFAMKANSELHLLQALAKDGFGADVVSFGEVEKALQAGFRPENVIYSGVAKSEDNLTQAIRLGLGQINVESLSELARLKRIAASVRVPTRLALRMNLAMDVPTHPYIQTSAKRNKFGIPLVQLDDALKILKGDSYLQLTGISAHIGSQITDLSAFAALGKAMRDLIGQVVENGFSLKTIDLGGGLGIDYTKDEDDEPRVKRYLETLAAEIKPLANLELMLEPGRILTARAGVLVAKVEYVKQTPDVEFLILNTGTHHLIRPALYGALHRMQPLRPEKRAEKTYDIVGLLCESSDCFAKDYKMPEMREGEWLAIRDAGAYGRVMASCYNESPWPPEVVVLNDQVLGEE
jgi:diaminopimelate decarboxylase